MAGFYVALACDHSPLVKETHERNHPETRFVLADVTQLTLERLRSELKQCPASPDLEDVDLVAGGPPCQGFSAMGPRDPQDERNALVFAFAELVIAIRPKVFILENVLGLLSARTGNGKILDQALRILQTGGYRVTLPVRALNAAHYGVPQFRQRVFVLGVRADLAIWLPGEIPRYPRRTHYPLVEVLNDPDLPRDGMRPYVTLAEAIGDLPANAMPWDEPVPYPHCPSLSDYELLMRRQGDELIYNHHTKGVQELRLRRIRALKEEGSNKTALPPELQSGGHPGKYRRLRYSEPCPTVTAHIGKDLSDFIHPWHDRWITGREAARVQSFCDRYRFYGSQSLQLRVIGNAVPPLLGAMVTYQACLDVGLEVINPVRGT